MEYLYVVYITLSTVFLCRFARGQTTLPPNPIQEIIGPSNSSAAGNSSDVRFFCISSRNGSLVRVFYNDVNLTSKIDVSKPLAIVVHGWMDRFLSDLLFLNNTSWPLQTIRDWSGYVDTNACGVDWSALSETNYVSAAILGTRIAAYWLARLLWNVNLAGIPYARMTIAGHSLGSHVAGFTGKHVRSWTGGSQELGTIFGLDPAGPLFTFPVRVADTDLLQPTDASFVQIIHTSAFSYGAGLGSGLGNASFAANGGVFQPLCAEQTVMGQTIPLLCSHVRAVQYFRYSLNPALPFVGRSCGNSTSGGLLGFLGLVTNECAQPITDRFGIYTNRTVAQFDLQTTGRPPFCIGC